MEDLQDIKLSGSNRRPGTTKSPLRKIVSILFFLIPPELNFPFVGSRQRFDGIPCLVGFYSTALHPIGDISDN